MKARLFGIVAIAMGIALGWFFGLAPLEEARAGAAEIKVELKIFLVGPMLVVSGLALILGGAPVWDAFNGPPVGKQQIWITVIVTALALAAGGIGWRWMDGQLTALGYR